MCCVLFVELLLLLFFVMCKKTNYECHCFVLSRIKLKDFTFLFSCSTVTIVSNIMSCV